MKTAPSRSRLCYGTARISKRSLVIFAVYALQGASLDTASFLRDLVQLDRLAMVDDPPVRMVSTWDPTGGNADGFRPEWVKGNVYTIADLTGPGVIRRFYSARPAGLLRIWVDGGSKPLVQIACEDFFNGRLEPFTTALTGPMGGGFYSFFPIAFSRSLRIEIVAAPKDSGEPFGGYYQVTWQKLPDVESLRLPLTAKASAEWERVAGIWRNPGAPPPNSGGPSTQVLHKVTIAPGETGVLASLDRAGIIDEFHVKIESADPHHLRRTMLEIRWDQQEHPAVQAPIGDFFGNGFSRAPFRTVPIGLSDGVYYSYLAMPFASGARIQLRNDSESHPLMADCRIRYRPVDALPSGMGRFHAKWRREVLSGVELHESNVTGAYNYSILEAQGKGRYIGANLNVYNRHLMWWGEGDPMIFTDSDTWPPSLHGTGTEEYFNDAWGFHTSLSPVSGVLLAGLSAPGRCFGPNAVFTFHLADSIPFQEKVRVTIEHGTENNLTNDYSSTAYWYALPGSRDFFTARPVADRLAPLPDTWEKLREDRIAEFLPELRRQVKELAASLDRFPTNAYRHPRRVRVLRLVFQLAAQLRLDPAELKRLEGRMNEARRQPLESRFPVFDSIWRDLAKIL